MNRPAFRNAARGAVVLASLLALVACGTGRGSRPAAGAANRDGRPSIGAADGTEGAPPVVSYPGQVGRARPIPTYPTTTSTVEVETPTTHIANDNSLARFDDTYFDTDSALLTPSGNEAVDRAAHSLVATLDETQSAEIDGWTDSRGTSSYNDRLAASRVAAVVAKLTVAEPSLVGRLIARPHGTEGAPDPGCEGDCPGNRIVTVNIIAP